MEYIIKKFGLEDKLEPISKLHGKKVEIPDSDMIIIPLYHPAVAVYNRNMLDELKEDFEILKDR
jgi:DNA polymerase